MPHGEPGSPSAPSGGSSRGARCPLARGAVPGWSWPGELLNIPCPAVHPRADCWLLPSRSARAGTFTNQIQKGFEEPRLLITTDPRTDHQSIKEAAYMNIPVIAFCDTDSDLQVGRGSPVYVRGLVCVCVCGGGGMGMEVLGLGNLTDGGGEREHGSVRIGGSSLTGHLCVQKRRIFHMSIGQGMGGSTKRAVGPGPLLHAACTAVYPDPRPVSTPAACAARAVLAGCGCGDPRQQQGQALHRHALLHADPHGPAGACFPGLLGFKARVGGRRHDCGLACLLPRLASCTRRCSSRGMY